MGLRACWFPKQRNWYMQTHDLLDNSRPSRTGGMFSKMALGHSDMANSTDALEASGVKYHTSFEGFPSALADNAKHRRSAGLAGTAEITRALGAKLKRMRGHTSQKRNAGSPQGWWNPGTWKRGALGTGNRRRA
jgi:hypothetical protein